MMTKIKILDTIVDEMLEILDYKNYSKEEKEGARDCSKWIKKSYINSMKMKMIHTLPKWIMTDCSIV